MEGKIAFEEHFNLAELIDQVPPYENPQNMIEIKRQLLDVADERLGEMDASGIAYSLLSLMAPGVQAVAADADAVSLARQANDYLAEVVAANPTRFGGMTSLPLGDPDTAIAELERATGELGFPGVMINGYTDTADGKGWYYDDDRYLPFWERVEALGTPVYLHPRNPLPANAGIYEGHPELMGAVWQFTVETATHALRLFTSGLFDRFPDLKLVLGHFGETLPAFMWRIEHRLDMMGDRIRTQRPLREYLQRNLYVTVSGNFHTPALTNAMTELGIDHVLFSTDYPFESMREASDWFDKADISDNDRRRIASTNARTIFPGIPERIGKA